MTTPNNSAEDERAPLLSSGDSSQQPSSSTTYHGAESTSLKSPPALPEASTNNCRGTPAGLPTRLRNDENLLIFRQALGFNVPSCNSAMDPGGLEAGRKTATGVYGEVLKERRKKWWHFTLLSILINVCHIAEIVIGALLTALGPTAGSHTMVVTALGATNTVVAGVLALIKGQGLPDRLHKDEVEFRRLQDWIEETDALLAVGVLGRDKAEVGLLVTVAFKKYNAAKASAENNKPNNYVRQGVERAADEPREREQLGRSGSDSAGNGNAIVRLNIAGMR